MKFKEIVIGGLMLIGAFSIITDNIKESYEQYTHKNRLKEIREEVKNKPIEIEEELSKAEEMRMLAETKTPEEYKDKLNEVDIIVTEDQLEKEFSDYGFDPNKNEVVGFYSNNDYKLVLEAADYEINESLGHEIAHMIDLKSDDVTGKNIYVYSHTDEFIKIFEEEKEVMFPREKDEIYRTDAAEYFAECYSNFVSDVPEYKEYLEELAPKTAEYMRTVVFNNQGGF